MDFNFSEHGALVDSACVGEVPPPDYPAVGVRAGQSADDIELRTGRPRTAAIGQQRERIR